MKRINILVVAPWLKLVFNIYPSSKSELCLGAILMIRRFLEALAMEGVRTFVVSDYVEGYPFLEKFSEHGEVYRLPKRGPFLGKILRRTIDCFILSKRLIKKKNIDVVYFLTNWNVEGMYYTSLLYHCFGLPVVMLAEVDLNLFKRERHDVWLVQKCLKKAQALHVLTQGQRDSLVENGLAADKIFVISNTVSEKEFSPEDDLGRFRGKYGIGREEILITYVRGRVHWAEKLLDLVVPDMLKKYENVRVCLMGFPEFKNRASNPRIIITDYLTGDMLKDAMATTDIGLVLKRQDLPDASTSTRMAEMALAGQAIVMNQGKALTYIHGEDVILAGDYKSDKEFKANLISALSLLIENAELRKKLANNCRKKVIETFNYASSAAKMIEMFTYALKNEQLKV